MENFADVVVVGGGIVGTSVAYFMSKAGLAVTLVEKERIASGASGRNGGGYRQSARALPEMPLAVASIAMAPRLWGELGGDVEYVRKGNLRIAESERELEAMAEYVPKQQAAGLKEVRLVTRQEALEIAPALAPDRVFGGTFCSTDGHINPMRACVALADGAQRLEARILTQTAVTSIEIAKGKVTAVHTTAGRIATRYIINAAGAGSIAIAAMAGLHMPARATRHQIMLTEKVSPLFQVMFGVASASIYWRQTASGNVLFGGSSDGADGVEVGWPPVAPVSDHLLQLVPSLRDTRMMRVWVGQDATTPDHLPIIGPARELEGFIYASGYSGHGVPLGPITGRLLTELIVGGKPSLPFSGLEPDRFN